MLVAYGILTMLVVCDVVGWILAWILGSLALWKICVVSLYEYVHDVCGKVFGMCKLCFMNMAKFCGYVYG